MLAALAEVAEPVASGRGQRYLADVFDGVTDELAEVGAGLQVTCVQGAADMAVPLDDEESFGIFVDLELGGEGLPTKLAIEAVGCRLGIALVAAAALTD